MARKPLPRDENGEIIRVNSEQSDQILPYEHLNEVEQDVYGELFAGLGDSSDEKVLLYRLNPESRKQALLCRLDPGTSVEDIPPRFGGGDYIIKRLKSGMIMKQASLSVEGEPIIERPKPAREVETERAQPDILSAMQTMMAGMQEANRQLITGLAQIMRPSEQPSRADMLHELQLMQQMFAPNNNRQDPTDILMKGIELAKSIQPRDGDTSGMDVLQEAIRSFAPAVTEVVRRAHIAPQRPQGHKGQGLTPPSSHNGTSNPALPSTQPQGNDDMTLLKYYLNLLCQKAAAGSDPALYAEMVADNLNDAQLEGLLAEPDIVVHLMTINPEVGKHTEWFKAVEKELREMVSLTDNPEVDSVTKTVTDITNNVTTGNDPA